MQTEGPWGYTKLRHFKTSKIQLLQMFVYFKEVCFHLQQTQHLSAQAKRDFSGTARFSSKSGIHHWLVRCRLLQDVLQNVSASSLGRKLAWVLLSMNKNDLPWQVWYNYFTYQPRDWQSHLCHKNIWYYNAMLLMAFGEESFICNLLFFFFFFKIN